MRLIDGDALKKDIERRRKAAKTLTGLDMVMLIDSYPTVGSWISVKQRLPEKSMSVITATHRGAIQVHEYSAKWKAFNAIDSSDESIVKKYNVNAYIEYWMPVTVLPGLPGSESK